MFINKVFLSTCVKIKAVKCLCDDLKAGFWSLSWMMIQMISRRSGDLHKSISAVNMKTGIVAQWFIELKLQSH